MEWWFPPPSRSLGLSVHQPSHTLLGRACARHPRAEPLAVVLHKRRVPVVDAQGSADGLAAEPWSQPPPPPLPLPPPPLPLPAEVWGETSVGDIEAAGCWSRSPPTAAACRSCRRRRRRRRLWQRQGRGRLAGRRRAGKPPGARNPLCGLRPPDSREPPEIWGDSDIPEINLVMYLRVHFQAMPRALHVKGTQIMIASGEHCAPVQLGLPFKASECS